MTRWLLSKALQRETGLTLIETMVTTALLSMVALAVLGLLVFLSAAAERIEASVKSEQMARNAINQMARELRMTTTMNAVRGFSGGVLNPPVTSVAVTPTNPGNVVTFQVPTDSLCNAWSQPITYALVTTEDLTGDSILQSFEDRNRNRSLDSRIDGSVGVLVRRQDISVPADGDVSDPNETTILADNVTSVTFRLVSEDANNNGVLDLAEDTNGNGVLDAGEDRNGNGRLDASEDTNGNTVLDKSINVELRTQQASTKSGVAEAEEQLIRKRLYTEVNLRN